MRALRPPRAQQVGPAAGPEANQQLLDEALAEQRAENKKQVQALLADPRRFEHTETGARLSLSPAEVEWLLQVLNDIRVGKLGSAGLAGQKARGVDAATRRTSWRWKWRGIFRCSCLRRWNVKRDT